MYIVGQAIRKTQIQLLAYKLLKLHVVTHLLGHFIFFNFFQFLLRNN